MFINLGKTYVMNVVYTIEYENNKEQLAMTEVETVYENFIKKLQSHIDIFGNNVDDRCD